MSRLGDYIHPVIFGGTPVRPRFVDYVTKGLTASGDINVITGTDGYRIMIFYLMYSNKDSSLADISLRFGTTGDLFMTAHVPASGGTTVHNFTGCAMQTAPGEVVRANLGAAGSASVTIGYIKYQSEEV